MYDTDDPVNADFSLGSPTGATASKGKERRIGMGEGDGVGRGTGRGGGKGRGTASEKTEEGGILSFEFYSFTKHYSAKTNT